MSDNRSTENYDQAGTAGGVRTDDSAAAPGLGGGTGESTDASPAQVQELSDDEESGDAADEA